MPVEVSHLEYFSSSWQEQQRHNRDHSLGQELGHMESYPLSASAVMLVKKFLTE